MSTPIDESGAIRLPKAQNALTVYEQMLGEGFEKAAQRHGERLSYAVGIQALPTGRRDEQTGASELNTLLAIYVVVPGAEDQTIVHSTGMVELVERSQEDCDEIAETLVANIINARQGQEVSRQVAEAQAKADGTAQPMSGLLSVNGQSVSPGDITDGMQDVVDLAEGR